MRCRGIHAMSWTRESHSLCIYCARHGERRIFLPALAARSALPATALVYFPIIHEPVGLTPFQHAECTYEPDVAMLQVYAYSCSTGNRCMTLNAISPPRIHDCKQPPTPFAFHNAFLPLCRVIDPRHDRTRLRASKRCDWHLTCAPSQWAGRHPDTTHLFL